MDILVTGAAGFVGRNLVAALECIRDGKTVPIRVSQSAESTAMTSIPLRRFWRKPAVRQTSSSIWQA